MANAGPKSFEEWEYPPGTFGRIIQKRQWDNNFEFAMSCIASSIRISQITQFPKMIFRFGGASFFVPYLMALLFLGRPLLLFELCLGQFTGVGSINLYSGIAKAWRGVGITQCIMNFIIYTYHGYLLAVSLYYSYLSMDLRWTKCEPEWHDCNELKSSNLTNTPYFTTSSVMFYMRNILGVHDQMMSPPEGLLVSFAMVWLIAGASLARGVKIIGKLACVCPFIALVLVLVIFLEAGRKHGAVKAMVTFINPQWDHLARGEIWSVALRQVLYSFAFGTGAVTVNASYTSFQFEILEIPLTACIISTLASVLSALTLISTIGCTSAQLNVTEHYFVEANSNLLYTSYADSMMCFGKHANIYAAIFFIAIFFLGIHNMTTSMLVITTNMLEFCPKLKEWHASLIVSFIGSMTSIVFLTAKGPNIINWLKLDVINPGCIIVVLLQTVMVTYHYGLQNWCWDVEAMTTQFVNWFWRWAWTIWAPIFILVIFILNFNLKTENADIGAYSIYIQCAAAFLVLFPIPFCFIYSICKCKLLRMDWRDGLSNFQFLPRTMADSRHVEYFRLLKLDTYEHKHLSSIARFLYALVESKPKTPIMSFNTSKN